MRHPHTSTVPCMSCMTQSKSTAIDEEIKYYTPALLDVTSGPTPFGQVVRRVLSYF